jgi:ABC-type sulfate transport system permease component
LKKILLAVTLIVVFLIVFIPFASSNPDGLEKVALTYGAQEQGNVWNGLITDYSLPSIGNQYVSTLVAGIFGVTMVLVSGLLIGKFMMPKAKENQEK